MNEITEKILKELEESDRVSGENDRRELEDFRREKKIKENLEKEVSLLGKAFENFDPESIPDELFEKCPDGKGLAAEYALMTLIEEKKNNEREKKEKENNLAAVPDMAGGKEEAYFSPEDVRKMSEKEIRKNYKIIMKSMEKWN